MAGCGGVHLGGGGRLTSRVVLGVLVQEEREVQTSYTSNPRSLLRHEYTAAFWIATKPL